MNMHACSVLVINELVCSPLLSLSISKMFKDYKISGFIEMNCDKLYIDLF